MQLDDILTALTLEQVGEDRYRGRNAVVNPVRIFGGQLLAQSVVAGLAGADGKLVKTLHTVFARAGTLDSPVDITVESLHGGRSFASSTVTISQGDRLCARSSVLLSGDGPDLIRHGDPAPSLPPPPSGAGGKPGGNGGAGRTASGAETLGDLEMVTVGDVDLSDPDLVGPPEFDVWVRFPVAADVAAGQGRDQALLAWVSDMFLVGTAMRPHAGVGQAQAHISLQTGVVSHTLTFHEPFSAHEWLLLSQRSTYAGRGHCHGRANVFRADGTLVASFVQDGFIREMAGRDDTPRVKT